MLYSLHYAKYYSGTSLPLTKDGDYVQTMYNQLVNIPPLSHRGDHDGDYTLSTVRYQSEGEEDETVILENPTDDSKV